MVGKSGVGVSAGVFWGVGVAVAAIVGVGVRPVGVGLASGARRSVQAPATITTPSERITARVSAELFLNLVRKCFPC